ncbi:NADH-ubiquinone oxidoreductase assembly factor N7BML [Wickerhamiella sorbophila]|uniref:NADH-ubiquinone oxidoreductase assembly factor N7BML n=1 Tax=Wickerhamiella sorbophila TaxID=45607 RepID=A0A2T0FKK4_9ASCO|nr:NADH-ubiquinone oxidoreductase assembly factor N7BML [Wickerhamiella sorbophila]PRT55505.1 NADH-ubiquinone oxidoreductase assembly factor N7BML [Wickerhamiella sorbophila]
MGLDIPWTRQLWHRWKALRNVPWRKSWFVGYDLDGNSYWESTDYNNPYRLRRRVEWGNKKHMADFRAVPQWMQWLRHARPHPPTLEELIADQRRQQQLKLLAQQADQRWNQIPVQSTNDKDPRLASAWTGGATPAPVEEPELEGFVYPEKKDEQRVFNAQQIIKQRDAERNRGSKA